MKRLSCLLLPLLLIFPAAAREPRRIVSLAPSVTASLYALGMERNIVGISVYCPAGTLPKERIGTLWEPNVEKILSLSPDLVIATREGNKKATVQTLERLGISVYVVDGDRDFEGICTHFVSLGKQVGQEERARDIVAAARARVAAVREKVKDHKPVRVFMEVGARPLFTVSRHSYMNDFCTFAGGTNIFEDLAPRYARVSREEVLKRDPDALLLVAMGDVTPEEEKYWRNFTSLSAVKRNLIFVITAPEIVAPTPSAFARGVEIIAGLLHGIEITP